ncbi:MAG: DEAD/DEAH box helicase [Myxococcaceae bacterium]|nr:DEAD/DEAH box helicase [Myxococcaceae bacterium]MCA3014580.1 DEAD/DEAH box helicase [Myxococcaceae bacterium]
MSLFNASVDLNPHQIEAALFALQSPLSKGVLLADEVGLGKTIEAGIVICQLWAERKRKLLVICPASLRKQWAIELQDKFDLPVTVLDTKTYRDAQRAGVSPLHQKKIVVMSYHYANRIRDELNAVAWDLVVIDEAHKLRNAYRPNSKLAQGIRWATDGCRKLLLTATPLQNSLTELYGLSTLIDEHLFGDLNGFRSQYANVGGDLEGLRARVGTFCKRTLRKDVLEYVRYTKRRAITRPFSPTDDEHRLYEAVTAFLQRADSYAIPKRQRHLTELVLRKLLASSSHAIAATLDTMKVRLEALRVEQVDDDEQFAEQLVAGEDLEDELLDEILELDAEADDDGEQEKDEDDVPVRIDRTKLTAEIALLAELAAWARSIGTDTKTRTLLNALDVGFEQMTKLGAQQKALLFTESRRTQEYLKLFLEANGYAGRVALFNGTNGGQEATAIYEAWVAKHAGNGRVSGSRDIDMRTALVEHFESTATILIATEAAAEGVNLQFCSLVINYDLPWNPQRVEQRIGRCHRYGQKHDVVVINFLNERNHADRRVLELLQEKFELFDGVFGASDKVLGTIDSGVDFEKKILAIYQECRTTEAIETAFQRLQAEMDASIRTRMSETREKLFEHFDEDVHDRLRLQLENTKAQLDRVGRRFWSLTRHMLAGQASFDDDALQFELETSPGPKIPVGRYHLISRTRTHAAPFGEAAPSLAEGFLYRLSHPLGERVLESAKALGTPTSSIVFDVSNHATRLHVVEALQGQSGWLALQRVVVESYDREEYLLFSAINDEGKSLDQETCEKIFSCDGRDTGDASIGGSIVERLRAEMGRHQQACVSRSLEENSKHFHDAREKLDKWASDLVKSAEKAIDLTKERIEVLTREARRAPTMEEQRLIQEKIAKLEQQKRKQRKAIFDVEDDVAVKRDALIASLERRLSQKTSSDVLFTIRWTIQ